MADMPTGWSSSPVDNSSSGTFCGLGNSVKSSAAANVEADFADGNFPVFDELLASFDQDISQTFQTAVKKLDACTSFQDEGSKFTLGRMSFPAIGDESAAYAASGSVQGFTLGIDFVFVVKGRQAALCLYGDLGTPDIDEFQQLVTKAVGKIPS